MQGIACHDSVRLTTGLPEVELKEGDLGIVTSSWYFPTLAYEVEFNIAGRLLRLLLLDEFVKRDVRR